MSRSARKTIVTLAVATAAGLVLAGCAPSTSEGPDASAAISIGSQAFSENEIIAYIYGQALEDAGIKVEYNLNIGSRETYIPALLDGSIDLLPEYSGGLLTYFDAKTGAVNSADVLAALPDALPAELSVLEPSEAQDTDSLNVTAATAAQYGLVTIGDLSKVDGEITIAANPEFAERPFGSAGLASIYGVTNVTVVPIGDYGGPATLAALLDGTALVADIYSTTASIVDNDLVTLADPEGMFPAQNVLPLIVTDQVGADAVAVLNKISAKLTTRDLLELNVRVSGAEKADAKTAAKDWLVAKGLIG